MTIKEFYEQKGINWCQNSWLLDKDGKPTDNPKGAVSFCFADAIFACYPDKYEEMANKVRIKTGNLREYNDAKTTTLEDILKLCEELKI